MIGRHIANIELGGYVFTAFKIFCKKHDCKNIPEGIRLMIRELPEYKELVAKAEQTGNNSKNPHKSELPKDISSFRNTPQPVLAGESHIDPGARRNASGRM